MKSYLLIFVFCLFSYSNAFSQTIPPEDDIQFWSETTISLPLVKTKNAAGDETEKLGFFINGNLRVGGNVSRFVDERIGFGFEFFANKYLTVTPSYLYRAGQPYEGAREFEHRIRFDTSVGKKWSRFSLKNRNRFEYRIRNSRADSVRYRNKTQLTVPVKKNNEEIFALFAATEPFYDFREDRWTRNEFSIGVGKKISRNFSADFFYLLQNNRSGTLKRINAFGVNFKIHIDRN